MIAITIPIPGFFLFLNAVLEWELTAFFILNSKTKSQADFKNSGNTMQIFEEREMESLHIR